MKHYESRQIKTDVVVVGGGLAGYCAAISAAEMGADVVILEKQSDVGGSTVLSGGFFAFADTPIQRSVGITDRASLLLEDLRNASGNYADEALLKAYVEGQAGLFSWLIKQGAEFTAVELSASQSVPRSHRLDSGQLISTLAERAQASGRVRIFKKTPALRLLRRQPSEPITGVLAEDEKQTLEIVACGGVVLATGGFARSEDLLQTFAPTQARALRVGGSGNQGDGLRMAWQLGAGFCDMGYIKGTFGTHPQTGHDKHEILLAYYLGAIIVNASGYRFIDESLPYKELGDACLQQPNFTAWQILDHAIFSQSPVKVPLFDLRPALERGLLLRADTLDELAQLCGISSSNLKSTIANYNASVDGGYDSAFGRDGLCNHAGRMAKISQPPFYAYPSTTTVLATYCGLTIDRQARVNDVFGELIEGLFAAGEITGGFHGNGYMTGSSLAKAAFFGRTAGFNAAARAERA